MLLWLSSFLLWIAFVEGAELLRIPLTSVPTRRSLDKRGVGVAPLLDEVILPIDLAYFGLVSIGSPSQNFYLLIDTGSSALWVADVNCVGCNVSNAVLFDPEMSNSIENTGQTFELLYGQGAVQCTAYSDFVTFANITVPSFTFGSCAQENDLFFEASVGIMGLSFPYPQTPAGSWLVEAYQKSLIPSPSYSLILGRYQSNGVTDGSLMIVGGYDEDLVEGSVNWVPTSGSVHVQVPMDGVILNGITIKKLDNTPMQAIIDSGTGGVLFGPKNVVKFFYEQIGGQESPNIPGMFQYPCNQLTSVGFQLGGQNYMMNKQDFVVEEQGGVCLGALALSQDPDDTLSEFVWILGALWMKNVVSVFDLGKPAVGFASLRGINSKYGTQTIIPESEETALGTGPSAHAFPTFTPSIPPGPAVAISDYPVTTVSGTGPLTLNSAMVSRQAGVPTSPGATVVSTSHVPVEAVSTGVVYFGTSVINPDATGPVVTVTETASNPAKSDATPSSCFNMALLGLGGVVGFLLTVV